MSEEQCWARLADATRCQEPGLPNRFFCTAHGLPHDPHPLQIWSGPDTPIPKGLALSIRSVCPFVELPEAPFPVPPRTAAHHDHQETPPRIALQNPSPSEPPRVSEQPAEPSLDWMLAMLQEAMAAVMVGESTPLQKANALARLGGLYLRASGAAELKRVNRELNRRLSEMAKSRGTANGPGESTEPSSPASAPAELDRTPARTDAPLPAALMLSSRVGNIGSFVPAGRLKIAQQFSAGTTESPTPSPGYPPKVGVTAGLV